MMKLTEQQKYEALEIWKIKTVAAIFSRRAIDKAIGGYGIEYLGESVDGGHCYYVNMGDPYFETVIFCESIMHFGRWGDWIESGRIKERN